METEATKPARQRSFEVEAEIPGTPEQLWQAIATGPGITLWFSRVEVEERLGGKVTSVPDSGYSGRVTVWEPPRRFAYQFDEAAGPHAWEFAIETGEGGVCTLRLVDSFFVTESDWSDEVTTGPDGWKWCFDFLRLNQTHFPGQLGASVQAMAMAPGTIVEAWATMRAKLGLPALELAAQVNVSVPDAPALAGRVISVEDRIGVVLLDQPTQGIAWLATGGPSDEPGAQAHAMVHINLFGPDAAEVAAQEEPIWQAWLARAFPAS